MISTFINGAVIGTDDTSEDIPSLTSLTVGGDF